MTLANHFLWFALPNWGPSPVAQRGFLASTFPELREPSLLKFGQRKIGPGRRQSEWPEHPALLEAPGPQRPAARTQRKGLGADVFTRSATLNDLFRAPMKNASICPILFFNGFFGGKSQEFHHFWTPICGLV